MLTAALEPRRLSHVGWGAAVFAAEHPVEIRQVYWPDAGALKLFGKAAWAHDEVSDPQLTASFIGLTPVASFVVNGAAPSHDLTLLSGGAEWHLANGISLMAKFDGEFSDHTTTSAGTGRIRYIW